MVDLSGQTVLITGASRGIGAETATLFAAAGARVGLLARSAAPLRDLASDIGDAAVPLPCDVADYAAVAGAVDQLGGADILINNAGVIEPISHLSSSDPEDWGQVIDINLKGVYNGMRAALPGMLAAGRGTILTVSSGAAHGPVEAWSHYCASKAACAMLTRCVDKENGPQGIRAMGLSPGTVATQMQREIKASGVNPVSQLDWDVHIRPDWPARALLWMCGPDADPHIGTEISLRDDAIRRAIGLVT